MNKTTTFIFILAIFFSFILFSIIQTSHSEIQQNIFSNGIMKDVYSIFSMIRGYVAHLGYTELSTYYERSNNASLKNEYIQNHPGQSIIPFPWESSTSIRVLPFNYEIPAAPANNVSITACRDEFESGSFIINARKDLSGIEINIPDLYNAQGNYIPADAINIRLVKVWYQAGEGIQYSMPEGILAPELLLKDDSLVMVDYVNRTNYLKVTINGVQQYIEISNRTGTFPDTAEIHDTLSLQPFSLKENENKQVWLTVHIPNTTPSGDYYGDISLTTPSEAPMLMNFKITVLPFDLEPPPLKYGIYYRGTIPVEPREGIHSNWKTPQQYAIELQNMKDHGIAYPTLYQGADDNGKIQTVLSLRTQSGLPTDRLYIVNGGIYNVTSSSQADLDENVRVITELKGIVEPYGYQNLYFYGLDEATGNVLLSERPTFEAVHKTGAKLFVACYNDAVDIVGDLLDVAVLDGPHNSAQVAAWHSYGQEIFSYDNPQVGVENPEIYRKNFGFTLWNEGYDGAMDYAYQDTSGPSIWNDFDDINYRDHVFAYPTSNGVIDTIQWEGWREGVDDTRYLATLMKLEGSDISARTIITNSLSNGEDMDTIRKKVIDQIL
jgi:hypothetical protein